MLLEVKEKDLLGKVYEYFSRKLCSWWRKGGGEFYTSKSIIKLMVEMRKTCKVYLYGSVWGIGCMFVQSLKFLEECSENTFDISVCGQESNLTTWKLSKIKIFSMKIYTAI